MFNVIPAIDLLEGKVVRLTQGDYDQVSDYDISPANLAIKYVENGAKRIHIVDLNGAKEGKLINEPAIQAIRKAVDCQIELGGGIRTLETAQTLLEIGIDYLILGSLLIKDPQTSQNIIKQYPNQVIAGLDAHGLSLAIEGWQEASQITVHDMLTQLQELPLSEIIYTDIAKDGMLAGPSFEHLKTVAQESPFPVIASGGVSSLDDIKKLKDIPNISGCIIGKAILNQKIELSELFKHS